MKKTVLLAILDGLGHRDENYGNAVNQANKPTFDRLWEAYPSGYIRADGNFVGLPEGQMGNSEVGHLNLGAGRRVLQSLVLINEAIKDGTFFENKVMKDSMISAKENNKALHLMGLLSNGGVHSHINHIFALLEMAKENGLTEVYVHAFLDGRDVDQKSAPQFLEQLEEKMHELGVGKIATVSGRYYAMDRDKRWERVEKAYKAVVEGVSEETFTNPVEYVVESYSREVYDEFVLPAINVNSNKRIENGDSIIFFNFRPDRAIQLSAVLTNPEYDPKPDSPIFHPHYRPENLNFVQLMKFSNDVKGTIAFIPQKLENTLGEYVSSKGLKQLRIAETEKYPHVTFFFDGGVEKQLEGAERILINSPQVATYDLKPEMSAYEVKDALIEELNKDYLDLVILNFANPDMVGHSGKLKPTIEAIEVVDRCLGEIIAKLESTGGVAIVTADHGNSDRVLNDDGSPNTAHTTSPVPVIITQKGLELDLEGKALADLAPTLLHLMGLEQPKEMTGKSLIKDEK